jgi:hypothetical protein
MRIIFAAVCLLCSVSVFSQSLENDVVSSSGESFSTNNIHLDWSIGEVCTESYTTNNIVVSQGFHQGNVLVATYLDNLKHQQLSVEVFPNPATNFISIQSDEIKNMKLILLDGIGKVVHQQQIMSNNTVIGISDLVSGIYFAKIIQNNKEVTTTKIIKQ